MTRIALLATFFGAVLFAAVACGEDSTGAQQSGLETATITVESDAGGEPHQLAVEIARTAEQRRIGLMFREKLGEDDGMLFIFDGLSASGFWMNNTLIPLDIAYLGEDGTIQEIRQGVPLDRTPLRPAEPYRYVVETNAGWFEGNDFGVGDRVVIPQEVLEGPALTRRAVVPALVRNPG